MNTYVIANWKSNKTVSDARAWFQNFAEHFSKTSLDGKQLVLCPSFTTLQFCHDTIAANDFPIKLGVQDISPFKDGSYTGAVAANQIREFAHYVIIGHSERRQNFSETDEQIKEKMHRAKEAELITILCVQSDTTPIPAESDIIAYEPVEAIGTGNPDSAENTQKMLSTLKSKYPNKQYIYGGSINKDTVKEFLQIDVVDGFLVGSASLDATMFVNLLSQW